MRVFRGRYVLIALKALNLFAIILLTISSSAFAQSSTITRSFDFRNGAQGWQAGFSDYPPADNMDGFYELTAAINEVPPELGTGTAFYIKGSNHSDDLFMFLKRRLDATDGVVAGQTYQVTFTITFGSNAADCVGSDAVWLKAGASPAEPLALLTPPPSDPRVSAELRLNVDKSNQSQGGIAASVTGSIGNGQPCTPPLKYVSIQRTHQHTSLVNANSRGELWLLVGTDSGFEFVTALYYQRIDVTLVPVSQQPPVLLSYLNGKFQSTGHATALTSQSLMNEPFKVLSEQNFFSPDQHTRLNLFAYDLELKTGEDQTVITTEAEDAQHRIYNLPVEAVSVVPNFGWITQVTVKLPDELQGLGTVLLSVKLRGMASNKLPITIN